MYCLLTHNVKVLLRWKMLFSISLNSDFIFGKNVPCQLLWLIFKNKSDFFNYDFLFELSAITTRFCSSQQPSQNVPAASNFAAYNEISAAYFTLKFINNKCKVWSLVVQIVTKGLQPLLPVTPAILPTTPKHFDWAELRCIERAGSRELEVTSSTYKFNFSMCEPS